MSLGGWLIVMDRAGRDVKQYQLREGSVTLGSDPACDIRVLVPAVSPHHATVAVLYNQTVVRNVSDGETLVNGAPISVAALRHGDVISLGGRELRWEYHLPDEKKPLAPEPALVRRVQRERARAPRRGSEPPPRNVIVSEHRASMPASSSGKQVAIVQPQRRDTGLLTAVSPRLPSNHRSRSSRLLTNNTHTAQPGEQASDRTKRRSVTSPRDVPNLSNTTKATLWIESRKSSPRKSVANALLSSKTPVKTTPTLRKTARKAVSAKKSTPLRLVVLKKAQSAQKMKVTKIEAPLKIDSTKQAAIMLMTRHTPKSKQTSPNRGNRGPSFIVKKPSPVRLTPKNGKSGGKRKSTDPPGRTSHHRSSIINKTSDNGCPSIIEITDSETQSSTRESSVTRRSGKKSLRASHSMSFKKSALKDPNADKSNRKLESIKFDLSNLDDTSQNRSSDIMLVSETGNDSYAVDSDVDFTLRFSDTSTKSPSLRKSINSRSSRMLENTLGTSVTLSPKSDRGTWALRSPRTKKSLRGSIILQEALRINNSDGTEISTYSRRTTKSVSDQSWSTTIASTRRTRTLSPRVSRNNLESYSIVDLVSTDSTDSIANRSGSVYNSADSYRSANYDSLGSQQNLTLATRRALGCSTPYDLKNRTHVNESPDSSARSRKDKQSVNNRRGMTNSVDTSVTTPENTEDTTKSIILNSTKISRATKKRFQISRGKNVLIMDEGLSEDDSSPKSSKRISKIGSQASPMVPKSISLNEISVNSPSTNEGIHTPENRHSPVEASTPVLHIQNLLDATQNSNRSPNVRRTRISKRKTIGALHSEPRRGRSSIKSKSLIYRKSSRGKKNFNVSVDNAQNDEHQIVTPKSAAKPLPEGVKNKHSSAKKPQSKRSLIDNLNELDIVKQLFNSPVKRKLSRSMTEFSRRHLFDDDEDRPGRPTRAIIAVDGRTPDHSFLDHSEPFTPEVFVSPLNTPCNSPNMTGIKRLFQRGTPDNDLRNVRGVKALLRTPRTRTSLKNDFSNISGIKTVFAKSPRNRLSDVRVKKLFAASPKNDLRRVTGVKGLLQLQKSPRNELDDIRGVRSLFKDNSPKNDLRNVSGVKRTLRCNSPRNDLTDVRGVKGMFRLEKQRNELSDVSGVEKLFHESANYDSTFDQLLGRPPIRAVYTKSKSFTTTSKVQKKGKNRKSKTKSLHDVSLITNNVEEWLQKELMERLHNNTSTETSGSKVRSLNQSKNVTKTVRELQKLNTDTIDGSAPLIISRTRNSSFLNNMQPDLSSRKKSASELYGAHTLPIKKRSLVNASIHKSINDRSHNLPIKKRAVVHSTPVKGRVNLTMNASEMGRMSPISCEDKTVQIESVVRSPQRHMSSKAKSPLAKTKPIMGAPLKEMSVVIVKLSPKKTRSVKLLQNSPPPVKTRRGRRTQNDNHEARNIKKRRSSIVVTKKTPMLSPKPSPKVTRNAEIKPTSLEYSKVSPKKSRSTRAQSRRGKSQVSIELRTSPKKNTRAKVRRTSVIVTKPTPKRNPRPSRSTKDKNLNFQSGQQESPPEGTSIETKRQVKSKQFLKPTQPEVEQKRKSRKTDENAPKMTTVEKSSIKQTRHTRKTIVETAQTDNTIKSIAQTKRTRKTPKRNVLEEPKSLAPQDIKTQTSVEHLNTLTRRSRRTKINNVVQSNNSIKHNIPRTESAPSSIAIGQIATEDTGTKSRRGRKAKPKVSDDDNKITVTEDLPTRRTRKRKNTEQEVRVTIDEPKKKETRSTKATGRKDNTKITGKLRNARIRGGAGDKSDDRTQKPLSASTTSSVPKSVVNKPEKEKKAAVVADSGTRARGRMKRTNLELSDAKETKEPAKKARKAFVMSPVVRNTRARHNIAAVTASYTGGRARRR